MTQNRNLFAYVTAFLKEVIKTSHKLSCVTKMDTVQRCRGGRINWWGGLFLKMHCHLQEQKGQDQTITVTVFFSYIYFCFVESVYFIFFIS